ncbi:MULTISPECIES: MgtC/SapB family protein [Streptomyces]|uniref:MgtC/SapB family protein n=1 Tax=Streptomyces TaxID=1883 RepID=UPI000AFE4EC8|nr:MgtC/SapB family protein [Streptomyces virginiae]
MLLTEGQMAAHLAAALGLGAVIGLERQWRARLAGLRTNALVAGGAALFVLLSQYGFLGAAWRWATTARGSPPRSSPGSASSAPE